MKVLNLYAGIGGNRKLWGDEHKITAIEIDPKIAKVYKDHFPNDEVLVTDAHQYLIDHYGEFDFIWSSPPCPTHSKISLSNHLSPYKDNAKQLDNGGWIKPRYPDMALYQEIIFLKHFFKGKWCVENVISYYEPLIKPYEINAHYFWCNFHIDRIKSLESRLHNQPEAKAKLMGFDYDKITVPNKRKIINNCVEPETGLHIFQAAGYSTPHNPIFKQGALL